MKLENKTFDFKGNTFSDIGELEKNALDILQKLNLERIY